MSEAAFPDTLARPLSPAQLLVRSGLARRLTAVGTWVRGEVGYLSAADTVTKAIANGTLAQASVRVICLEAVEDDVGLFGVGPQIVTGLVGPADPIANPLAYLDATAGGLTATMPTTGGHYIVPCGQWLSSTVLYWHRDPAIAPQQIPSGLDL